jgi:DNA-binding transcriptional regulator YiaG
VLPVSTHVLRDTRHLPLTTDQRYSQVMPQTPLTVAVRVRQAAADGSMRTRRESTRTSLPELASLVHVTTATLSRWERGTLRPTVANAGRWVRALEKLERDAGGPG